MSKKHTIDPDVLEAMRIAKEPCRLTNAQHARLLKRLARARHDRDEARRELHDARFISSHAMSKHYSERWAEERDRNVKLRVEFDRRIAEIARAVAEKVTGLNLS